MNKIVLLILLSLSINLFAQDKEKPSLNKKRADIYYDLGIYQPALPTYLYLHKKDPENSEINLKVGVCLLNTGEKTESVEYLERSAISGLVPAYFYLGQALHAENKLDEALAYYLKFKSQASVAEYKMYEVDRFIDITLRAKEMMKGAVDVTIDNMGAAINSSSADYVPLINADESILTFTSRRDGSTGGEKDPSGKYYEDIYISYKENGSWSKSENLGSDVNTNSHDASVSLSADGQKMIIYRTTKGIYGGDLYISELIGKEWSKPQRIAGEINSIYWEPSACFSADSKTLYFSSNRPGGYGGMDIYMSNKLPDGTWGLPMNLGGVVNTEYDDDAPFMHPDGKTLYFSSHGHTTMGGFDIFKSVKQADGNWSLPENIGYPVNTVDDDMYFVLSANGKHGYYSSSKEGGEGEKDIYVITFPQGEVPLTVVTGKVLTKGSSKPINARITVIDNDTKEVQGLYNSNSASGKFIIVLPPHKTFKAIVEADGYYPYSEDMIVTTEEEYMEFTKDIFLISKD